MIIRPEIFDAQTFADGLARTVRGVLRVGAELSSKGIVPLASAWLITDTLVVICDYIFSHGLPDPPRKYLCYHSPEDPSVEADLVHDLPLGSQGLRPALLRLRQALPDRALTLKSESLVEKELVLLLHFPRGGPRPQLSIGRLISKKDPWLRYDASTEPGSGGGPIFSADWALAGMHVRSAERKYNEGLSLAAILEVLRESETWSEIARYHNLADVTAARQSLESRSAPQPEQSDTTLLHAALRWSFDPEAIPQDQRERLKSLVNDPSADLWTMRVSERQRLLLSAGSLQELRKARGKDKVDDPGQEVIDRILQGPPFNLDEIDEEALPYWLQAVRWFAEIVPSLPTPAEVNINLERRRIKSRLYSIAGPDFRGRATELEKLNTWYSEPAAGPIVISGIGGVGKSSLVAQFAKQLPGNPLLLWLDFDRADLSPDDAVSVLTLLSEQLKVQRDNYSPPEISESSWETAAKKIGASLTSTPPPLVVLDGFEVAQQVRQHHEIWQVLKLILAVAPGLRIIVSGRAPVKDLNLDGRKSEPIHLIGMAAPDAKGWLHEHGITDDQVVETVIELSNGVPLILKLASRLIEEGGEIKDLPAQLPKALVEGFLYQRILDRVIDPLLKPVARDALVLRGLTENMIPKVLGDSVPEGLDAKETFSRLSLELGLVGDEADPRALSVMLPGQTGVLRLRPEVRTATLKLLEMDNATRVREIDQRAVAWYGEQDLTDVSNAAELVYHCLRLGNIEDAEKAWQDACADLLIYAEEDLPEAAEAERAWLRARVSETSDSLEAWEKEAAERVKAAFSRGLLRVVPDVLKERTDRSSKSPLAIYDAWVSFQARDVKKARSSLGVVEEIQGSIDRDRAALAAWFAAEAGDRREADRLLEKLDQNDRWTDRPNGYLEALAVRAARIRLASDLPSELQLSRILEVEPELEKELKRVLTPSDVILPSLCQRIGLTWAFEDLSFHLPTSNYEAENFLLRLDTERSKALPFDFYRQLIEYSKIHGTPEASNTPLFRHYEALTPGAETGLDLATLGWRRWDLATASLFLANAADQMFRFQSAPDPLSLAIAATLAAFRGRKMMVLSFPTIDHALGETFGPDTNVFTAQPPPSERVKRAWEILLHEEPSEMSKKSISVLEGKIQKKFVVKNANLAVMGGQYQRFAENISQRHHVVTHFTDLPDGSAEIVAEGSTSNIDGFQQSLTSAPISGGMAIYETTLVREYFPKELLNELERPDLYSVMLYLLGPDPLEVLCRRILGLSDVLNQ